MPELPSAPVTRGVYGACSVAHEVRPPWRSRPPPRWSRQSARRPRLPQPRAGTGGRLSGSQHGPPGRDFGRPGADVHRPGLSRSQDWLGARPGEAYAIGDQDTLSVTFDGGARWTQLLPAPAPVGLVDAVTATTALAAQESADAGAILRSGNGGRSWSQVAHLPGVVTRLDFWSASDGIAASCQPGTSSPWPPGTPPTAAAPGAAPDQRSGLSAEDPASAETFGNGGCPDPPRKKNPPR
jgi:photosystem II stability/assembly factor-like uncharacterized protein